MKQDQNDLRQSMPEYTEQLTDPTTAAFEQGEPITAAEQINPANPANPANRTASSKRPVQTQQTTQTQQSRQAPQGGYSDVTKAEEAAATEPAESTTAAFEQGEPITAAEHINPANPANPANRTASSKRPVQTQQTTQTQQSRQAPKAEDEKRRSIVVRIAAHYKQALTVDFDKPLSFRDQMVIMAVVLFFTTALFSLIYIVSLGLRPATTEQPTAAEVSEVSEVSEGAVQSGEASRTDDSRSEEKDGKPEQTESTDQTEQQRESEQRERAELSDRKTAEPYFSSVTTITAGEEQLHRGYLILINKDCDCRYDGENLATLLDSPTRSYAVTDARVSLQEDVVPAFDSMMQDFYDMYGSTDIMAACGYRSLSTQAQLYQKEIEEQGEEEAEKWVAPPGFSEHQSGLAVDLNLTVTGSGQIQYESVEPYAWINENCHHYGFIVRYPKGRESVTGYSYESWHFRYVGYPAAQYIAGNDMTLEEYLDIVHTKTIDNPLLTETPHGMYAVYYIPAEEDGETELTVPSDRAYTVSGDNYSGYIITVSEQPPQEGNEAEE